jgi:hypothetical protein
MSVRRLQKICLGVSLLLVAASVGNVAIAGAAPAAPAATTPVASMLPSLDEIIARHIAARGGAERLHALQTMRAIGVEIFPDGKEARVVREVARPGRVRIEVTYQGLSSVYAHDGTNGWEVVPQQGRFEPEALPAAVAKPSVDQLDIEGPLLDWRAKGHAVTLVGRATIGNRLAYELQEKLSSGAVRHDYIDTDTYLVLRTDTERVFAGRKAMLETTFGDYKKVGGLAFPHHVVVQRHGRAQGMELIVETIELDPVIDPARFRMPAQSAPVTAPAPAAVKTPAPQASGPG